MHNDMHKMEIEQLYEKIRVRRVIGRIAEKVGIHRNTVRNQFKGVSPLDPSVVDAATKVLAEVANEEMQAQQEIDNILKENAPLLAGLE